jgi:hypothetical protein
MIAIAALIEKLFPMPTSVDFTRQLVETGEIRRALDIGCGGASHLTQFRPLIETTGLESFQQALEKSRITNAHNNYVQADLIKEDPEEVLHRTSGGQKFDLVTLYGVIEHFPRTIGIRLLDIIEKLSCKYILLETPNGFQPQGPEFGNDNQRHLSGWFPHDFESFGYSVHGTTGTRYLTGYAAMPRYNFRGNNFSNSVLARLLAVDRLPLHAFNLVAIKDVRGVRARLTPEGA